MRTRAVLIAGRLLLAVARQPAPAVRPSSAISGEMSPVRKVVTLIQEMKAQVEKEASADLAAYEKFECWCKTNEEEKTASIAADEQRIEQLSSFIEEAAATAGQLKSEISGLEADIAEDQEALATATASREKELAAFQAEEADMKETRGLLKEAMDVLSKVQLLQRQGKATPAEVHGRAREALLQIRARAQRSPHRFEGVLERDLFEVLGSIDDAVRQSG